LLPNSVVELGLLDLLFIKPVYQAKPISLFVGKYAFTEVCALCREFTKLGDKASTFKATLNLVTEAAERYLLVQLTSLGNQGEPPVLGDQSGPFTFWNSPVPTLLSYFDKETKDIVRKTLVNTSDESMLWRATVECYKQAASSSGSLHADNYYDPLEEACVKDRKKNVRGWIAFWIQALHNAPHGPTLFYPPASLHCEFFSIEMYQNTCFGHSMLPAQEGATGA
jgi:hypothetical protein